MHMATVYTATDIKQHLLISQLDLNTKSPLLSYSLH